MLNESVFSVALVAFVMLAFCLVCVYLEMRKAEMRKFRYKRAFRAPHFTQGEPCEFEAQRKRDAFRRFQAHLDRR